VQALAGGIAVQHRMAYQGEYFLNRYGPEAASHTPPVARMLQMGIPVGAGTDATRVASYNPWVCLFWLVSGKTVGGTSLSPQANRLDRAEALRRYTLGSAWFSGEETKKGALAPGQFADLAVLSADYFSVAENEIKDIESDLTIVDGRVVHGAGDFSTWNPPRLPVLPEWSPVKTVGGYHRASHNQVEARRTSVNRRSCAEGLLGALLGSRGHLVPRPPLDFGCDCFAF